MTHHDVIDFVDDYCGHWTVYYRAEDKGEDGWSVVLGDDIIYRGNAKSDDIRVRIPKNHLPYNLVIDMADTALGHACNQLDISYNEVGAEDIIRLTKAYGRSEK